MAQRKPNGTSTPEDLPPFFADAFSDEQGGIVPTRMEIYRVAPNGGAFIGEPQLDATSADLVDFVREEDKAYGRRGGQWEAYLKDQGGRIVKRKRFRVDRDPSLPLEDRAPAAAAAPATDPAAVGLERMIAIFEAQSRAYEQRVRADMSAREQQARIDQERREREWNAQVARDRAYYESQRERDRELADQSRERDRSLYGFLLQAKPADGGERTIETLLLGLKLAQEMGGGGGESSFGDKLIERLAGKFMGGGATSSSSSGEDAEPVHAPDEVQRARQARDANPQPSKARGRGKGKQAPPPKDDGPRGDDIMQLVETLLLNCDVDAAASVLRSLIAGGKLPRPIVVELAKGQLDDELEGFDDETKKKLHAAAQKALDATAPVKAVK